MNGVRPESNDDAGRVDRRIRLPQRGNHSIAAACGRAQIDEQYLIVGMVDDVPERRPTARQIDGGPLTLEDGVLEMIAEIAHGLEDPAESLVVGDVVTDEIGVSHGWTVSQRNGGPSVELVVDVEGEPDYAWYGSAVRTRMDRV